MTREPINSTPIAAIGYDPATSTLEVEFKSGGVWQYAPVPVDVAVQIRDAAHSAGRTFYVSVRGNPEVVATKIEPIEAESIPVGFPT